MNSVAEVYGYVKPRTHLIKVDGEQLYQIAPLKPPPPPLDKQGNLKERPGHREGNAREIQLTIGCSSAYLESVLSKSY